MTTKTFKVILLIFSILLFIFVFSAFYLLAYISRSTATDLTYFPKTIYSAYKNPSLVNDFNFVILGLDPRNDLLEKTDTTDTIMIGRLTSDWQVNLISIPRDLWVYSLNSKTNQIYPQSLDTTNSFNYIQDQFSRLVGQPIIRTMTITTRTLEDLTGLIGGVDLYLETGFRDDQYPNPDYIKDPSSEISMYKTVEFKSGWVHLDNSNISEFVRSRKSLTGGTDLGRIQRQQLLINALISKIKSPEFLRDRNKLFALYRFYHSNIHTNFTDYDLASIGLRVLPHTNSFKINPITIPAGDNPQTDILYHPTRFINNQWVFIPQDPGYKSFREFIKISLNAR